MDAHTTSAVLPAPTARTGERASHASRAAGNATAPRRFHAVPPRPLAAHAPRPVAVSTTQSALGNVIILTASSGGVGLSTLAAMLARVVADMGLSCALIDADLDGGGLDVLLGIESEPGLTMQELHAPLGSLDGDALNHELPEWEQVRVLACAPWRGDTPDPWEVEAAIEALAAANQVVLVDAGRGRVLTELPVLASCAQLVGVELSVLGLARAKAWLASALPANRQQPLLVGFDTRGAPHHAGLVAIAEATAYLGDAPLGCIRADSRLCGDILEGLGIRAIPRRNRAAVEAIAVQVARLAGCEADVPGGA